MFMKTARAMALLLLISVFSTGLAMAATSTPTPIFMDSNGGHWYDVSDAKV